MKTVNIHEAKTNLSKLIDEASRGESFVIAKSGKPMVMVTAVETPVGAARRRVGFMANQFSTPSMIFDRMSGGEIEKLFGGGE